ncbi:MULTISPECIES: spiralin lipoprotein [unclassified Spiroplasma]|uniref:spiralin lipoprotein n=1 Tax=unclassified Spiroplasma TaxID=2637901 RepID=UPI0030CCD606
MKKLLAILGAFGLTTTGATTVVVCNKGDNSKDTLGGLKASDFEKALLGVADDAALNTKVIGIVAGKVTDEAKNKEITDNLKLFGYTFVVTTKDVTFSLEKDKKFTLTIKKATDDQIKDFYKKDTNNEMQAEDLTTAKKIQGYVSGTEFSSEITVKE